MQNSIISPKTLLMELLDKNFDDFKADTIKSDSAAVFELAPTITAVKDVHFYMTTYDWADEYEMEYLLKCENPLKMIADVWEEYSENRGKDLDRL